MTRRLVFRGLDLLARLPGCGFIGWALLAVAVAEETRGKTTPN